MSLKDKVYFEIEPRLDEVSYGYDVHMYDRVFGLLMVKPFATRKEAEDYIEEVTNHAY